MTTSGIEKGPSARKVEGERPVTQEDLLCKIKTYLIACKTPADDWQSIKDCVEEGVGFPEVRRRPPESANDDGPQAFKDESMPQLKSNSRAARPIKSVDLLRFFRPL